MKPFVTAVSVVSLLLGFALSATAQKTSPSAAPSSASLLAGILTQMEDALGSSLPNDVLVSGTMQIESGGRSETATITAAARSSAESYEVVAGEYTNSKLVFANGEAASDGTPVSQELACTAQSALIPGSLIYALASDPNTGGEVIGQETINGVALLHVRTWTNFPDADWTPFSQRDWWIDPASGLVHRLVFERRGAGGATAGVEYQYDFLGFQNEKGALIPTTIRQSVNGTDYAVITINSVQTNIGLTDLDFPVR